MLFTNLQEFSHLVGTHAVEHAHQGIRVEQGHHAIGVTAGTEVDHTVDGHVRVEDELGHEHTGSDGSIRGTVTAAQVDETRPLVHVLFRDTLAKQRHGGQVENVGIVYVKNHLAVDVSTDNGPHSAAQDGVLPTLRSIHHLLGAELHGERGGIVGISVGTLYPHEVGGFGLLPGHVVPLVPHTVVELRHAHQHGEQPVSRDDFLGLAVVEGELSLTHTDTAEVRTETLSGTVEHLGKTGEDIGRDSGGAVTQSNYREIAHVVLPLCD